MSWTNLIHILLKVFVYPFCLYLREVTEVNALRREKGSLTFDVNGVSVVLSEEDLLIDMARTEGYVSDGDNEITVVLDTKLTHSAHPG